MDLLLFNTNLSIIQQAYQICCLVKVQMQPQTVFKLIAALSTLIYLQKNVAEINFQRL